MNGILTVLIFSPLVGLLLLLLIPRERIVLLRWTGFLATFLPLGLAFTLFSFFESAETELQAVEEVYWFSMPVGTDAAGDPQEAVLNYILGVDGLSLVLILLSVILISVAAWASMYITERVKSFLLLLMVLEVGLLGTFLSFNLLLFFLFFEVVILAVYFMIARWGFIEREAAANQFLLYNGIGSGILLLAFITILARYGTLDYLELTVQMAAAAGPGEGPAVNGIFRWGLFSAILTAFAVKLPVVPLHTWMIKVNREAHPAVVMIESGVVLKIGAYGILRFGQGLFPDLTVQISWLLALLGLVNLLYGALLALVQDDLRQLFAYSSVSHMGIVLLGIAAANAAGYQGAIFQMISHGLLSPLLFFILLIILARTGTASLAKLGGLSRSVPVLSGFFMTAGLGYLAVPGLSGFISEFLAFLGLFYSLPIYAAIGAVGMILTAAYMLRAVLGTTYGGVHPQHEALADLKAQEFLPVVVLLGLSLLIGLAPSILSLPLEGTIASFMLRIGG